LIVKNAPIGQLNSPIGLACRNMYFILQLYLVPVAFLYLIKQRYLDNSLHIFGCAF